MKSSRIILVVSVLLVSVVFAGLGQRLGVWLNPRYLYGAIDLQKENEAYWSVGTPLLLRYWFPNSVDKDDLVAALIHYLVDNPDAIQERVDIAFCLDGRFVAGERTRLVSDSVVRKPSGDFGWKACVRPQPAGEHHWTFTVTFHCLDGSSRTFHHAGVIYIIPGYKRTPPEGKPFVPPKEVPVGP